MLLYYPPLVMTFEAISGVVLILVILSRYHTLFLRFYNQLQDKSSPPEVFFYKGILRNFAKFSGKHLCLGLSFDKIPGLRPATLLKERLWHRCFLVNFEKFLRTPFLQNTSGGCFCSRL